jgi:hypothetical protein
MGGRLGELAGELEADRGADEQPQPRLVGEERADRELPLGLVRDRGDGRDLRSGRAQVAALVERLVEDPLQRRRRVGDDLLRVLEALGVGQRRHGGVDLLGGVRLAVGHGRAPLSGGAPARG